MFDLDSKKLYALLNDDATLIIDSFEQAAPGLQSAVDSVSDYYHARAQANAYVAFGQCAGFGLHWDDHDVFIVQIEGSKTWQIFGSTRAYPMNVDRHWLNLPPDEMKDQVKLTRGSILYVPRGCWHNVIANVEPSLHFTIGVTAPTGMDLLKHLSDRARDGEFFRKDVPTTDLSGKESYLEEFREHVARIMSSGLIDEFCSEFRRTYYPSPSMSLPAGIRGVRPSEDSLVILASPIFSLSDLENNWEITFADRSVKVTRASFDSIIKPCIASPQVIGDLFMTSSVRELGITMEQMLDYVTHLCSIGLLKIRE